MIVVPFPDYAFFAVVFSAVGLLVSPRVFSMLFNSSEGHLPFLAISMIASAFVALIFIFAMALFPLATAAAR